MIAVFSGFIGSSEQMIKMIGFGLAIAVFFDAFVVRMAIVPGGARPARPARPGGCRAGWTGLLPNVDVEGEKLDKELSQSPGGSDEDRGLIPV